MISMYDIEESTKTLIEREEEYIQEIRILVGSSISYMETIKVLPLCMYDGCR